MVSATLSIFCLAFAGHSFAQTITRSLFIPGADTQPIIGSVIGSDYTALTYALQCADPDQCGLGGGVTLTEGPSTAAYTMAEGAAFTGLYECSLAGTSSAVCFESFGGSEANDPGSSTLTLTGTDYTFMPVALTGGAGAATASNSEVIKSGPSLTTPTSTSSKASQTDTTTSNKASGSGNAASQSSSVTTSATHAGGPAVTGNAMFVMGGAAMAMAVLG